MPQGAIAQLVERLDRTQEVSGSNPLSSTPSRKLDDCRLRLFHLRKTRHDSRYRLLLRPHPTDVITCGERFTGGVAAVPRDGVVSRRLKLILYQRDHLTPKQIEHLHRDTRFFRKPVANGGYLAEGIREVLIDLKTSRYRTVVQRKVAWLTDDEP